MITATQELMNYLPAGVAPEINLSDLVSDLAPSRQVAAIAASFAGGDGVSRMVARVLYDLATEVRLLGEVATYDELIDHRSILER